MYYRTIARCALKYYEKVLCISPMTLDYANKFYGIPAKKLEFFCWAGDRLSRRITASGGGLSEQVLGWGATYSLFKVVSNMVESI